MLVPLCMRTKHRQQQQAGATPGTAVQHLQAYKAALHESRQHMTTEQLAWWDTFWEEQVQICHQVEGGEVQALKEPWVWYVRPDVPPNELPVASVAVLEATNRRRLRRQPRSMYTGPRRSAARRELEAHQNDGNLDEIEVGHTVALQCDDEDNRPFWLAKVTAINKTADDHVISIHWWRTDDDAYEGRYVPDICVSTRCPRQEGTAPTEGEAPAGHRFVDNKSVGLWFSAEKNQKSDKTYHKFTP